MEMFKCYVPRSEYIRAKDKSILIFNILRKQDTECHDVVIERRIAKYARTKYMKHDGTKSILTILDEYLKTLKEQA